MKVPEYPGDLTVGSSGAGVVLVQRLLCLAGVGVKCDGEFGPCTAAAVARFAERLAISGGFGPSLFSGLTGNMRMLARFKPTGGYGRSIGLVLNYALSAGIREFEGNAGPWVAFFMNGQERLAWCAGFATEIVRAAGAPIPVTWGCSSIAAWAKTNLRLTEVPSPGALFLVPHADGNGYAHTGVVAAVPAPGVLRTVEGNSNDSGSANGDRVVERFRPVKGLMFVRLP